MASIEVRILREALLAGKLSPVHVATYIRTLRRELREVERLVFRRFPSRHAKRQH